MITKYLIAFALIIFCCDAVTAQSGIPVYVSQHQTTLLLFPAPVKDADWGTSTIATRVEKEAPTVLKIKAKTPYGVPTNLSVFTEDNLMYQLSVCFDSTQGGGYYDMRDSAFFVHATPVPTTKGGVTMFDIKKFAQYIPAFDPTVNGLSWTENKIDLRLRHIYILGQVLFFDFSITNNSAIPYDLNFARFYIRDRMKAKRTSSLEQEIQPLFMPSSQIQVGPFGNASLVVVFNKFTIADSKYFIMELFEKNGDRHLVARLKGKHILKAQPLLP